MTHDEPHQALTSERLAEIRQMLDGIDHWRTMASVMNPDIFPPNRPEAPVTIALRDLLAEVERSRASLDEFIETASEADMQINERMTRLESDNERLRAREAALLAVVRLVANIPDSEYEMEYPDGVYLPARRVRATLWASTDIRQQARAAEGSSSYGE